MEKQRSREKRLSLIVASLLGVVNECAVRSCEDISKDPDVYPIIKNVLKDKAIDTLYYDSFIFYLFNAVDGIDKKLEEAGFGRGEFDKELSIQLKQIPEVGTLPNFDEIKNYDDVITKFMGHKLCKELNVESAIIELKINVVFMGRLRYGFYPAINNALSINRILEAKAANDIKTPKDKICPKCGEKNLPDAFRCRNENCLEILPQCGNEIKDSPKKEYSEVVLRITYAYHKSLPLSIRILDRIATSLNRSKIDSDDKIITPTEEQKSLILDETSSLLLSWFMGSIKVYIKDPVGLKEAQALLSFWFNGGNAKKYLNLFGRIKEVQSFEKNVSKIFHLKRKLDINELNVIYEEFLMIVNKAFVSPIFEIKEYIFIDKSNNKK